MGVGYQPAVSDTAQANAFRTQDGVADGRTRALCALYALTVLSPSIQKRQGISVAVDTPTRGPVATVKSEDSRSRTVNGPPSHKSRPLSSRPRPSALVSRAGPRARSRSVEPLRATRARSTPFDDLPRADKNGRTLPIGTTDEVDAVMHAIGEVDVQEPGRPEHYCGPRSLPSIAVGGGIQRTGVRLDFGNAQDTTPLRTVPNQQTSEKVRCDVLRRTREERARHDGHPKSQSRNAHGLQRKPDPSATAPPPQRGQLSRQP